MKKALSILLLLFLFSCADSSEMVKLREENKQLKALAEVAQQEAMFNLLEAARQKELSQQISEEARRQAELARQQMERCEAELKKCRGK